MFHIVLAVYILESHNTSIQDMQANGAEFHNGNQVAALIGEYDRLKYHLREEQVVSLTMERIFMHRRRWRQRTDVGL